MSISKKLLPLLAIILSFLAITILYYNLTPTRYAVFAGYNKNGIIEPYVITYLKELDKVTSGIVYIADSTLKQGELDKLKGINIIYTKHQRHQEYDWGSYKRGYNYLRDNGYLKNADELIFANDSCYAPLTSFKPMFKEMSKQKNIDFWGNTISNYSYPHIQSYFMVFRKKAFQHQSFTNFFNKITHQPTHSNYVKQYEILLTPTLRASSLYYKSYTPNVNSNFANDVYANPAKYPLHYIKNHHNQFIKRKFFTSSQNKLSFQQKELLDYLKKHHKTTYNNIISSINKD